VGAGDVVRRCARLLRSTLAAAVLAAAFPSFASEPAVRSSDGRWLLQADNEARTLVATDAASGAVVRRIPVADKRGKTSRVTRIVDAPPRKSFVVLLADIAEAWELSYDPKAEPVYDGLVHDYRMGEGIADRGPFAVRRVALDAPLVDGLFSEDHRYLVARAGAGIVHVVNLDVRRVIERLRVDGDPAPSRGVSWKANGVPRFAFPDARGTRVFLLTADGWRWDYAIELPAPTVRLVQRSNGGIAAELQSGQAVALPH